MASCSTRCVPIRLSRLNRFEFFNNAHYSYRWHGALRRSLLAAGLTLFATASVPADLPISSREQLNATLWQQRSVEYQALATAMYRQATARLSSVKTNRKSASTEQQVLGLYQSKRPAIVLDIDETVLDNTPFNAMLVRNGRDFDSIDWGRWVADKKATGVPGARDFIRHARAKGFRVVFITNGECNRNGTYAANGHSLDCPQKSSTIDNLATVLGYKPAAQDVLLRYEIKGRDDSDKKARRGEIARTHRIAMLVGDDLNDFIRRVEYRPDIHRKYWGAMQGAPWYVVPNPIYGSWERGFADLGEKYNSLMVWNAPVMPPTARLILVSWNLEWLADPQLLETAGFWTRCSAQGFPNTKLRDDLPFCDVYKRDGILTPEQYEQNKLVPMRARFAELAAQGVDIFAVQETSDASALSAVLPAGYKVSCFTQRVDAQNLGFAVREAANLRIQCREIVALSQESNSMVPRPVRRGLELKVESPNGTNAPSLTLLNVHLKSSCPTGRLDSTTNDNCATLQQQAPALEIWIEEQANQNQPFIIVGDWNRDLDAEVVGAFSARNDGSDPSGPLQPATLRNLWPELNDGVPANSRMEVAAIDRSIARGSPSCHDILDQLAVSVSLKSRLLPTSLENNKIKGKLISRPAAASDHCPLQAEFLFR